jgi:hypothetical protein
MLPSSSKPLTIRVPVVHIPWRSRYIESDLQQEQDVDPGQVAEECLCQDRRDEHPLASIEKAETDHARIQIENDQEQDQEEQLEDLLAELHTIRVGLFSKLSRVPFFFFFEFFSRQHTFKDGEYQHYITERCDQPAQQTQGTFPDALEKLGASQARLR